MLIQIIRASRGENGGFRENGKEPLMYLYRDADQNEIDVVLEQDGTLYPVEIKKNSKS
jgi:predicted RecB family endonuclease